VTDELYVYYRVAHGNWRAALQIVRQYQERLHDEHPGLTSRVLRRSDEHADGVTLMEIYSFDPAGRSGVDDRLLARIEAAAAALSPLLTSPRQVERFSTLD
jgi:hypothetical protein